MQHLAADDGLAGVGGYGVNRNDGRYWVRTSDLRLVERRGA
jgi:hypothetical protein